MKRKISYQVRKIGDLYYVSLISSEVVGKFGTKEEAEKEVKIRKKIDLRNQKGD